MTHAFARLLLLTVTLVATGCAQIPTGELSEAATNPPAPAAPPESVVEQPAIIAEVPPPQPAPAVEKVAPRDMWERIRAGFAMRPMDSDLVRDWEIRYSAKPEYFARMVDRGSHYLFHIVEEIERRKMPAEIALLPMIESAYNPQAYSKAHASGLWQFIPSTGRIFGLRQNWWYDGRRDVIAATSAALDYLEKLYGMFGDWELALASYNWGEGAVSRAIARNQAKGLPGDYASLTMPAETRNYLPKLIAVKNIIADPARFGVQLASVPNEPYFEVVTLKEHIDVKLAARFAEMPVDEFRFLNPAHNKRVIKSYAAETIVLPRNKVALFHANLQNHDKPLVSWQAHTLKRGEKPEKVAAKYGISLSELKEVNGINGKTRLRPGQPLLVPVKEGMTPNLPDLPATPVTLTRAYKAARTTHARGGKRAKHATRAAIKRQPAKRAKVAIKPPVRKGKPPVVASQSRR